ncbi:hypothetical protein GCM10010329_63480 [Streptomyces spiroverticillatus]|uniref:Uncharacterized protein n=1 Tax=Streptomyces finlayi TaxID=67296 RepID=A0A918X578_9ACTN|nr:hypothetical protein [Streptomyces finlayi]GHA31450.1 hypothetical protein GCM10010329_63480 [Streptomyces spiroverticillatus]GHD11106.1 hypothetical protein GCM10010334_67070 [Streptomyces finlayi]
MRSEKTPFVGGPLDGQALDVLTGPTGNPPKWYEVPVPSPDGPPTVYAYERRPAGYSKRLGLQRGWKYVYVPGGREPWSPKWPWSKPAPESTRHADDERPSTGTGD